MSEFLGITRERIFSPGKIAADRAILEAVAEVLRQRGHGVRVVSAEETLPTPRRGTTVFTMSQGDDALIALNRWEAHGIRVVNSVDAIRNCHRHRMAPRLHDAGVATPATIIVDRTSLDAWPEWLERDGAWIKRGDVHATEPDDVVFVRDAEAARAALAGFRHRSIARAAVQRHVPGTVIKFYATVSGFLWWRPSDGGAIALSPDQVDELSNLAHAGARALGLEVFGGDCVVDMTERLQLIDINDWPSYASCRVAAAGAIATHLETRTN
ncbi:MAG TPA: hypothetical protein VMW17_16930 [Candidatus Binatia bacterium]|nr:hypothetical protein [Candidatus Binatia bacterium]